MNGKELRPLAPGATVGIMGGGQLGRMIALSAAELGYRAATFCEGPDDPAAQVCHHAVVAAYDDQLALEQFTSLVDVVTFEFENIPAETASWLSAKSVVRPNPEILAIAQDRILEKTFLNDAGIETAPWAELSEDHGTEAALKKIGKNGLFKTARFGYDGKGQAAVHGKAELDAAWRAVGTTRAVAEGFVDFECEISVIVARGADGEISCFEVVENQHARHILDTTIAPARINAEIADAAIAIAKKIATSLSLVGLIAVEMFVTKDGRVLVNEIAPRPHNSGHWTIDACVTSQFEQLVRAVCGLPLGAPRRHSNAVMRNLIGEDVDRWPQIAADPENKLHIYGKGETRPGRKMGHVTRLFPLSAEWEFGTIDAAKLAMS